MKKITYFIWSYYLIALFITFSLAIICFKFRHKKITHFIYYIHVFISMNQWYAVHDLFFSFNIITIGWHSTSRAWLLNGEHSNKLRHTYAEKFPFSDSEEKCGKTTTVCIFGTVFKVPLSLKISSEWVSLSKFIFVYHVIYVIVWFYDFLWYL